METLKNKTAQFISHAFHPLFMPTFGLLFFYFSGQISRFSSSDSYQENNLSIIGITLLFSLVLPTIGVAILKKTGRVSSFQMHHREERFLPFTITGISLFCGYFILFELLPIEIDFVLRIFYFGCILSVIAALGISLKWKISVHMIGIGGFTGAIFLMSKLTEKVYLDELIGALLLSGLIAFSRLHLNAHSFNQIVAGFALGFGCETFALLILP